MDARTLYGVLKTYVEAWKEYDESELNTNEKYYHDPGKAGLYTGRIEGMNRIMNFLEELEKDNAL